MHETASILSSFGFDPITGLYPGGVLPESLQNKCCTEVTLSPVDIAGMSEEDWLSSHPMSIFQTEQGDNCEVTKSESVYSQPDLQEFVCKPKRRTSRIPVPPEQIESKCRSFIRWINEKAIVPEYGILHPCSIEINPEEVLYIMIDAVMVDEQEETRVKGGKPVQKVEKTRLKHWNIRVETEHFVYAIVSMDEDEAYKELIAFILKNHLYNRYFLFFTDGETAIFTAIEKYFKCWEYKIHLDWYHVSEKVYNLLSLAIKSCRVLDPRTEAKLITKGKNKGTDNRKKTSLSRLYARALERILWFGNVSEAKEYLKHIEKDVISNQKALDDLIGYFDKKGKYIANSGVRKKAGLRNSSNGVEGQNMVTVADRQKDDDMSWREKGSASLAALSCLFANKEEEDWFYERKFDFRPRQLLSRMNKEDFSEVETESIHEIDSYMDIFETE